jgi:hypothetical protein
MPSYYGETGDVDHDDSLFPAYTDYINGVDTGWYEAPELSLDPLPYQGLAPIPYTNSMPSRHISIEPINTVPDGFVLDLRPPPVHPDMVKLIGSETLCFAPPPRRVLAFSTPSGDQHDRPVSSAEITRRKLMGASLQPLTSLPMQSPLHQLPHDLAEYSFRHISPHPRRMPARQATHSSLLRPSSATDIDSQVGTMPPSKPGMFRSVHSSSPADSGVHLPDQQVPQEHLGRQTNPAVQRLGQLAQPHGLPRLRPVSLIQPGGFPNGPRYAAASEPERQFINAQITELHKIANHDPNPESRKHAIIDNAKCNASVRRMVQEWEETTQRRLMEEAAQRHVQADMQRSRARLPEMENSFSAPQNFPEAYEHPMLSSQYQSQAIAIPHEQQQSQQVPQPQRNDSYGHSKAQTPTSRHNLVALINAHVLQYVLANRRIHSSWTDAQSRENAINWQNNFRATLPPEGLQYLDQEVAKMHHGQDSHQPVQPHQSVQYHRPHHLAQPDQPTQNLSKQYHANESSQASVPRVAVTEALQQHIHTNLHRLFTAMRVCGLPWTPDNAEMQHKAREFLTDFKDSLPPEGYAYIEGIVNEMRIERAEGRDPLNAMRV